MSGGMTMGICNTCKGHGGAYAEGMHKRNPQLDFLRDLGPVCPDCGGSGTVPYDQSVAAQAPYEYRGAPKIGGVKTSFTRKGE
ncbi:MAG: hypothetical protein EBY26_00270 [Microbacteriaceae bacterium]|nr:hypothetical protein [Microbacteriaceae bacterium]